MTESEFSQHVQQMETQGYTVLEDILTEAECLTAQAELERLAPLKDQGSFECLFNHAPIFERIYQVPEFLRFVRHFLGSDALLSAAHGSILPPGSGGGGLHADGAITGHNRSQSMAPADRQERITSHVLALNAIFCISEFTQNNGATKLAPGSHTFAYLEQPPDADQKAQIISAPQGSVLVFNVNTWHGPSHNSTDRPRYALLTPWRRFWTRCEYEMARVVKPEVLARAGEDGRRVFGLAAQSPYLPVTQWDRDTGEPKPEWSHLKRE